VTAPVDIARLEEFSDGTSDGLRALIRLFLTDTGDTIAELGTAVDESDQDAIRQLAHRAGGSCAVCGAAPLAARLLALEDRSVSAGPQDDARLIRAVRAEFANVTTFLDHYLERARPAEVRS